MDHISGLDCTYTCSSHATVAADADDVCRALLTLQRHKKMEAEVEEGKQSRTFRVRSVEAGPELKGLYLDQLVINLDIYTNIYSVTHSFVHHIWLCFYLQVVSA